MLLVVSKATAVLVPVHGIVAHEPPVEAQEAPKIRDNLGERAGERSRICKVATPADIVQDAMQTTYSELFGTRKIPFLALKPKNYLTFLRTRSVEASSFCSTYLQPTVSQLSTTTYNITETITDTQTYITTTTTFDDT
jgi:hypothetical protein